MKREIITGTALKPSPDLKLTEKEGTYVKGVIKQRFQSKSYPDKINYLIALEDTNGVATLWDKANAKAVEIGVVGGDTVFIRPSTVLQNMLAQVQDGEYVHITYTGKGTAKKGKRAPYLFTLVAGRDE